MKEKNTRKISLHLKIIIAICILGVCLATALCVALSKEFFSYAVDMYEATCLGYAQIAAYEVDPEKTKTYLNTNTTDEDYYIIQEKLQNIADSSKLDYLYIVGCMDDKIIMLWDTETIANPYPNALGDETPITESNLEIITEIFLENYPDGSTGDRYVDSEYLILSYYPVRDNDGDCVAVVCAELCGNTINERMNASIVQALAGIIILLIIFNIIYYVLMRKNIFSPISKLTTASVSLIANDFENLDTVRVDINTKDEMQTLAESFNDMVKELQVHMDTLTLVAAERERMSIELNVATQIQTALLPSVHPDFSDKYEFNISAYMTPAKEVGGDFYDFFMVDDFHLAIVIGDVSGKGVPAALFMAIGKTLIKDQTRKYKTDLSVVFSEVNKQLCASNKEDMFITAFEGVLNLITGEFIYVNAGHEIPFILHESKTFAKYPIKPGFVLAAIETIKYKSGSIMLKPGDKIFQYTDGVTEAVDGNNNMYGMDRLEKVLIDNSEKLPDSIITAVKEDVDTFSEGIAQFDDITMLCLEFKSRMVEEREDTDGAWLRG